MDCGGVEGGIRRQLVLDEYYGVLHDGEAVQATAPGKPGSRTTVTSTVLGDHQMQNSTARRSRAGRNGSIRLVGWMTSGLLAAVAAFGSAAGPIAAAGPGGGHASVASRPRRP